MWFIKDWCGILACAFTYGILIIVDTAVISFELFDSKSYSLQSIPSLFIIIGFNIIIALIVWSHLVAVLSNPGCVPKTLKKLEEEKIPAQVARSMVKIKEEYTKLKNKEIVENTQVKEKIKSDGEGEKDGLQRISRREESEGHRNISREEIIPMGNSESYSYKKFDVKKKLGLKSRKNSEGDLLYDKLMKKSGVLKRRERKIGLLHELFTRECRKCGGIKPPKAHHCSTCRRCICRLDHHCPWINNCVAYYTAKPFILFLFYVALGTILAFIIMFINTIRIFTTTPHFFQRQAFLFVIGIVSNSVANYTNIGVMAYFLNILFGLFTIIMLVDECTTMNENIDRLQGGHFLHKKKLSEFVYDVFGKPFSLTWFLPIRTCPLLVIEREYAEVNLTF